jgi:hypothetical protein
LIIEAPLPAKLAEVTCYSFSSAGTDFSLVPALVFSNRVEIPVYHFSGNGGPAQSSQATFQREAAKKASNSFMDLQKEIARQERDLLVLEINPVTDNLFPQIKAEIAQALLNFLKPMLKLKSQIASDCDFMKSQLGAVAWVVDVIKRYGLDEDDFSSQPQLYDAWFALRTAFCAGALVCKQHAVEECKKGNPLAYQDFVKLRAQLAAIEFFCDGMDPANDFQDFGNCLPQWYGQVNYILKVSKEQGVGTDNERTLKTYVTYFGKVTGVQPPDESNTRVRSMTVFLSGTLSAHYRQYDKTVTKQDCEIEITKSSQSIENVVAYSVKTNMDIMLYITWKPPMSPTDKQLNVAFELPTPVHVGTSQTITFHGCRGEVDTTITPEMWTDYLSLLDSDTIIDSFDYRQGPKGTLYVHALSPQTAAGFDFNGEWKVDLDKVH